MIPMGFVAPDAGGDDQEPDSIAPEPLAVTELGEVDGLTAEQEIRARVASILGPCPASKEFQRERDSWALRAALLVEYIHSGALP